MDPVTGVVLLAALPLVGVAIWASVLAHRSRRVALAGRLGLTLQDGHAVGQVEGFKVRLEGGGPFRLCLELGPEHSPVSLRASSLVTFGVTTGDPQFDASVSAEGPSLRLFAALDRPTRVRVRRLVEREVQVKKGVFEVDLAGDSEAVLPLLNDMVAVAQRFRHPDPRAQLLAALPNEPSPELAQRALEVLGDLAPAETTALLAHPQPEVRLALALAMRPPAGDVVVAMVVNPSNSLEFRRRALERLARYAPGSAVEAAEPALAEPALAAVALEVLADAERCPPLAALPPRDDTAYQLALARCLRFSHEPVEARLLELLAHPDPLVAAAAAAGLAVHGSAAAVGPLRARLERQTWGGGDLAVAVQAAVAAIQARVHVQGGALSVVAAEPTGGLSEVRS